MVSSARGRRIAAWTVVAATASAAQAQTPAGITLLQLSLSDPDQAGSAGRRAALEGEARTITSCEQAFDSMRRFVARGLKGELTIRTLPSLASLPPALRAALETRPVGRLTPVYGVSGHLRVLIRCDPSFKLPIKPEAIRPIPARPPAPNRTPI